MKKLVSLFLALILALAVLAVPAAAESMIPMTIKYGVLSMLNASEEQMINYYLAIWQLARQGQDTSPVSIAQTKRAAMPKTVCVYYDSLDAMVMALNAGEVFTIVVNEIVADYLSATNLMMNIQGK